MGGSNVTGAVIVGLLVGCGRIGSVAIATLTERGELSRAARSFLRTESGSAVLLLSDAVVALVWANSGLGYEGFWHLPVRIGAGGAELAMDLRHWVNDGLMVLFFF